MDSTMEGGDIQAPRREFPRNEPPMRVGGDPRTWSKHMIYDSFQGGDQNSATPGGSPQTYALAIRFTARKVGSTEVDCTGCIGVAVGSIGPTGAAPTASDVYMYLTPSSTQDDANAKVNELWGCLACDASKTPGLFTNLSTLLYAWQVSAILIQSAPLLSTDINISTVRDVLVRDPGKSYSEPCSSSSASSGSPTP